MPLINRKRSEKEGYVKPVRRQESAEFEHKFEDEPDAKPLIKIAKRKVCKTRLRGDDDEKDESISRPLITLKKIKPRSVRDIGEDGDEGVKDGGEGGIIGGEVKESLRTIRRGGTRGTGEEELGGEEPSWLLEIIKKARTAKLSRMTKQANKAKKAKPITLRFDKIWFDTMIQHHPRATAPLWDNAHKGMVKTLLNRFENEELANLIVWSIENWRGVMQTNFQWMKKSPPPAFPALAFLSKFVHVFKEAKEAANDQPLQIDELVKGLNLAKKAAKRRESDTPPVRDSKPSLPKKDLSTTVLSLPVLPDWQD